jgi:glycopeptide antibiotics resistance protein
LLVITIATGLASRHFPGILPHWVQLYLGDTFWALMVFLWFGFLFKRKSTLWIAIAAILFSYGIEISQLYHASWIDALRTNPLGGLILGFGFLWSDLVCYTIGVGFGYVMEKVFLKDSINSRA